LNIFLRLAKDASIYGLSDFVTKIISFLSFPILAAYLSINSFGELELIFTVTALLGLIINCGIDNSIQRFYWDKNITPNIQKSISSSGLFCLISLSIIIFLISFPLIIAFANKNIIDNQNFSSIAIFSSILLMIFTQLSNFILNLLRLKFNKIGFLFFSLLSRISIVFIGLFYVVKLNKGIDGFLSSQAFIYFPLILIGFWIIRDQIKFKKIKFYWIKKLIKYGYPFIFSGMAYWIFGSIDRWMLAYITDIKEVGIYSIAFRFSTIPMFLANAFGQAWSPFAIKIKTDYEDKYRSIYGYILILLLFIIIIASSIISLFSGEILTFLMPKDYIFSALPLCILSMTVILQASQQVTAVGISIERKTTLFAKLTWITAFTNIVLNFILINFFGATGASIATFLSYFLLSSCYLFFTQKLHPITIPWNLLFILSGLSIFLFIISVLNIAPSITPQVIVFKLILLLICTIIGFLNIPFNYLKKFIL
tara:strand:+ start:11449 stop:12891 length:1443 start_codon:yes stop_codon:yes gene_type:complete